VAGYEHAAAVFGVIAQELAQNSASLEQAFLELTEGSEEFKAKKGVKK
jgi:hypothetical protein